MKKKRRIKGRIVGKYGSSWRNGNTYAPTNS
jgi:hypothetical protein